MADDIQILNPATLPPDDNINDYAYNIRLNGHFMLAKGAMLAYYGQVRFTAIASTSMATWAANFFSSPLYAMDWIVAEGNGQLIIGHMGRSIASYDLEEGSLTVRASALLAFEPTLRLTESVIPGFVSLTGTGRFLASSAGPVIFVEPPARVDPQALLGWADCPTPSVVHDTGWMANMLAGAQAAIFGLRSGEEEQMDFTGQGTILVQSSEMLSTDRATLRMVEQQMNLLDQAGLTEVQRMATSRLQQA